MPGVALVTWMVERPRFGRIWSLRLFNLGATISYLGMGLFAAFGIDAGPQPRVGVAQGSIGGRGG